MALIFRVSSSANPGPTTIKNAPLTYAEGDGNFAYLLTNMSGSTLNLTGNAVITGDLIVEGLTQSNSTSLLFYNASTKRIFYQPTSSFLTAGPGILINGLEITSSVRSVNGIFPTDGNISVALSTTVTGTSASLVSSGSGNVTASLSDGLVWIITNDPDPTKNGDVFIYSSGSKTWFPAAPLDEAASDARYVKLDGANTPMTGHLNMGGFDINNVGTMNGTASFASSALSSSHALSASWAPLTPPGGSDTHIQFNSGNTFSGSTNLRYNYTNSNLVLTGSLDVSGSGKFTNGLTVTGSTVISSSGTALGVVGNVNLNGWVDDTNVPGNSLNWGKGAGTTIYFANPVDSVGLKVGPGVDGNSRFILQDNGNIITPGVNNFGIGTLFPQYRLDIIGTGPSGSLNIDNKLLVSSSLVTVSGSLDVSGSGRFTNGLTVTGSVRVVTGSLFVETPPANPGFLPGGIKVENSGVQADYSTKFTVGNYETIAVVTTGTGDWHLGPWNNSPKLVLHGTTTTASLCIPTENMVFGRSPVPSGFNESRMLIGVSGKDEYNTGVNYPSSSNNYFYINTRLQNANPGPSRRRPLYIGADSIHFYTGETVTSESFNRAPKMIVSESGLDVSGSGRFTNGLTVTGSGVFLTGSNTNIPIIQTAGRDLRIASSVVGVVAIGQSNSVTGYNKPDEGGRAILIGFGSDNNWGTIGNNNIAIGHENKLSTGSSANGSILIGNSLRAIGDSSSTLIGYGTNDNGYNVISINKPAGAPNSFNFTANNQTYINGTEYFLGTSGTPDINVTIKGNRTSESSSLGGNLTIAAGEGRGTTTPSDVILATADPITNPALSASLHTPTARLTVKGGTGFVGIGTSSPSHSLDVSGSARVVGSGSAQPLFQVIGSQGELFTVTDSLSGSLFSVNDISGLPVVEAFSDSTVLIGSYQAPALNTTVLLPNTTAGVNTIYTVPTASYDAVYMDYIIRSGSVGRAGTFTAMWSGSSTSIADISVTPFGDTSGFVFGANITGSSLLISGSGTTAGWRVKTIIRSI